MLLLLPSMRSTSSLPLPPNFLPLPSLPTKARDVLFGFQYHDVSEIRKGTRPGHSHRTEFAHLNSHACEFKSRTPRVRMGANCVPPHVEPLGTYW